MLFYDTLFIFFVFHIVFLMKNATFNPFFFRHVRILSFKTIKFYDSIYMFINQIYDFASKAKWNDKFYMDAPALVLVCYIYCKFYCTFIIVQ
jgi:hypothetical protein